MDEVKEAERKLLLQLLKAYSYLFKKKASEIRKMMENGKKDI